ncbi:glucosamine-6-phosphate deaminase [Zophobihabitans entericus]|uniref:Glucosamine-6-phosphate deaminase n=1 Tax=Zophobihabitans entericus TaxID=1635327 RepID=A0A6G9IC67_9GAMM|nr:glucosamine-6-phosphate deaminase [Zophobihabitans entericus]QIQ21826.1 glucosamine-6-phosphate deaminase [Zophobihabitans entericus]
MKIIYTKDYQAMSAEGFKVIKHIFDTVPNPVINTTTGASYDGIFELMVKAINDGSIKLENCVLMNLDEYISPRHASYNVYTYMHKKLYDLIKSRPKVIGLMDASVTDRQAELNRYNQILAKYPRDLQIVGLGVNGHLGANEPGTSFDSRLFFAKSDESTVQSTMLYNGLTRDEAPEGMMTLGLADIMDAKQVLVTASGKRKAEAVKGMIEGPITIDVPASILQKHPNVVVVLDEDAASLLTQRK